MIKGIMALRPLGYSSPKSLLYLLCFFSAQSSIYTNETIMNRYAPNSCVETEKVNQQSDSQK